MNIKKVIIIFAIILLSACSKPIPITSTTKIVAFGDSLTFGYGASISESWPKKLSEKLGVVVVNKGVSGDTTEDGLIRFDEMLKEDNPNMIILGLGGNDMLRSIPVEQTVKNLEKMIDKARENGIEIILLATPKPSVLGALTRLSDAQFYEEVAKSKNVILIDGVYSKWLSNSSYKSDPIHLNAAGYDKVAEDIAKKFKVL